MLVVGAEESGHEPAWVFKGIVLDAVELYIGSDDLVLHAMIVMQYTAFYRLLVHVAFLSLAVGEAVAVERGRVGGTNAFGNPGVAISEQVQAVLTFEHRLEVLKTTVRAKHDVHEGFAVGPGLLHALPEVLSVVAYVVLVEVVEHGYVRVEDVVLPLFGEADGKEQLGEVLRLLIVVSKQGGHGVVDAVAALVGPYILRGQGTDGHPVGRLLTLGAEGGTHANPELVFAVGIFLAHHVAEAVVGRAVELTIVVGLLGRAVDNLLQVGYLLDVDIDRSPRLAVVALGVDQRAHPLVAPGEGLGVLVDAGIYEVAEAHGSRLHVVGVHDTGAFVVAIGHADGGFITARQEVAGGVAEVGQVVQHAVGCHLLLLLLNGLLLLLFRTQFVLVVILTRGDGEAQAAHQCDDEHG